MSSDGELEKWLDLITFELDTGTVFTFLSKKSVSNMKLVVRM